MKPDVWGPHAWIFLHSITLEYPDNPTDEDKVNIVNFINSLSLVLPCQKCRINFGLHLEKYPLTNKVLESKTNLVKWMIDIHNCVNVTNNKKELSYEDSLKEILKLYNSDNKNLIIILAIILFVLVVIGIFLFNMFY